MTTPAPAPAQAANTKSAADRFQELGSAVSILKTKLRPDTGGKILPEDKAVAAKNSLLKGWDPDKATEAETQALLDKLDAVYESTYAEVEKAAATEPEDDGSAVELLKKAQAAHGSLSDEELTAAMEKLETEAAALKEKMLSLNTEQKRRLLTKSLTEKLSIKTSMDRAILDQVVGPNNVASKTKVGKV